MAHLTGYFSNIDAPNLQINCRIEPTDSDEFEGYTWVYQWQLDKTLTDDEMNAAIISALKAGVQADSQSDFAVLADENIKVPLFKSAKSVANGSYAAYGTGTAYSLTNSAAALNFGTSDPGITLTAPGKYRIAAGCRLDYVGATLAVIRIATIKLRRTNNTAEDIPNATASINTAVVTLFNGIAGNLHLPEIIYETENSNDVLELQGSISAVPSIGSVDAVHAYLTATKI